MSSTTITGIRQLSLVCVPTPDQDRAIEFYESLGLEKRTDVPFGGDYRWIEVYPPEGNAGIALAPPRPGTEVTPLETGITLVSDDIDATHAELKARGVDVDAEVSLVDAGQGRRIRRALEVREDSRTQHGAARGASTGIELAIRDTSSRRSERRHRGREWGVFAAINDHNASERCRFGELARLVVVFPP